MYINISWYMVETAKTIKNKKTKKQKTKKRRLKRTLTISQLLLTVACTFAVCKLKIYPNETAA